MLWLVNRLAEGVLTCLTSRWVALVVEELVKVRLPIGCGVMSAVIVKGAAGHLEGCEIGGISSQIQCIVGGSYGLIGISGVLLSAELLLAMKASMIDVKPFSTPMEVTLAALGFVLTYAIPRATNTVVGTSWEYTALFFDLLRTLARELQVVRMMQGVRWFITRLFTAAWDVLAWVSGLWTHVRAAGNWAWDLVSKVTAAVWRVLVRVWTALRRGVTALYNGMVGVLSPIWRTISSLARNTSTAVGNLCAQVWRALSNAVSSVWDAAQPLRELAWDIAARLGRAAWRPLKHAVRFLVTQFSKFTRAYWRLLPAGLALSTSLRFGLALL